MKETQAWRSWNEDPFSGFMNNPGLEVEVQPGVAARQELFSNSEVKKKVRGWGWGVGGGGGFLEVAECRKPAWGRH